MINKINYILYKVSIAGARCLLPVQREPASRLEVGRLIRHEVHDERHQPTVDDRVVLRAVRRVKLIPAEFVAAHGLKVQGTVGYHQVVLDARVISGSPQVLGVGFHTDFEGLVDGVADAAEAGFPPEANAVLEVALVTSAFLWCVVVEAVEGT